MELASVSGYSNNTNRVVLTLQSQVPPEDGDKIQSPKRRVLSRERDDE
jgi:hypothetical protein